jgi:hypothetical protein
LIELRGGECIFPKNNSSNYFLFMDITFHNFSLCWWL